MFEWHLVSTNVTHTDRTSINCTICDIHIALWFCALQWWYFRDSCFLVAIHSWRNNKRVLPRREKTTASSNSCSLLKAVNFPQDTQLTPLLPPRLTRKPFIADRAADVLACSRSFKWTSDKSDDSDSDVHVRPRSMVDGQDLTRIHVPKTQSSHQRSLSARLAPDSHTVSHISTPLLVLVKPKNTLAQDGAEKHTRWRARRWWSGKCAGETVFDLYPS